MQKAKPRLRVILQTLPIGAYRLQQMKGANNVGLNEVFGPVNGTVYMRFSRKVDHGAWLMRSKQLRKQSRVTDVTFNKHMAVVAAQSRQIFKVACVGQFVEVNDRLCRLGKPVEHKI